MILPPSINPDWNLVGSKDFPRISPSTDCFMSPGNKKWNHQIQFKKIITYERKRLNEHTTKCWARLSMNCVVTHFWTPRARDNVYLFRTKCKSVAHICWKIDKNGERNIFFFETLFELFSALFILPLCCQNHQVFLDWLGVFIMLNSFLCYLVFKVE